MATGIVYTNPGWVNESAPALNAENLNNMSTALELAIEAVNRNSSTLTDYNVVKSNVTHNANDIAQLKNGILIFSNQSIAASAWVADNTYSGAGYVWRALLSLDGVTAAYISEVNLTPSDALSGNYAPVSAATAGGVYVYAKNKPTVDVPVPSVVCMKQTT